MKVNELRKITNEELKISEYRDFLEKLQAKGVGRKAEDTDREFKKVDKNAEKTVLRRLLDIMK